MLYYITTIEERFYQRKDMRAINFIQGTEEWLRWRKSKICGSDISAIMKASPYLTPRELYYDKKDTWPQLVERKVNDYVLSRGHAFEQLAREAFNRHCGLEFNPICFESLCGKFGASLDGYHDAFGIEVKLMGDKDLKELVDKGTVPLHYYYQIQWQIFVGKLEASDLVAGNEKKIFIKRIERNDFCIDMLETNALEFHEMLEQNRLPDATEDDVTIVEDNVNAYNELFLLKKELVTMQSRCKELEEHITSRVKAISELAPTKYVQYGKCKLTKITRAGSIDYTKIIRDDVNPEDYRKPSTSYWKIDIPK